MRAWVLIACSGCITVAGKPDEEPSRWIGEISPRVGMASIDEPALDGASGVGPTFGLKVGGLYRFTRHFAAGLGVDFSLSGHDTSNPEHEASYWWVYLPVAVTRFDLGRFAISSWAGYYLGFRTISEPSCRNFFGSACTVASQKLHGGGLGTAALVRFRAETVAFELGPYVQLHWVYSKEDDMGTPFDEAGMRVRSVAIGIALQAAFGAPGN